MRLHRCHPDIFQNVRRLYRNDSRILLMPVARVHVFETMRSAGYRAFGFQECLDKSSPLQIRYRKWALYSGLCGNRSPQCDLHHNIPNEITSTVFFQSIPSWQAAIQLTDPFVPQALMRTSREELPETECSNVLTARAMRNLISKGRGLSTAYIELRTVVGDSAFRIVPESISYAHDNMSCILLG